MLWPSLSSNPSSIPEVRHSGRPRRKQGSGWRGRGRLGLRCFPSSFHNEKMRRWFLIFLFSSVDDSYWASWGGWIVEIWYNLNYTLSKEVATFWSQFFFFSFFAIHRETKQTLFRLFRVPTLRFGHSCLIGFLWISSLIGFVDLVL